MFTPSKIHRPVTTDSLAAVFRGDAGSMDLIRMPTPVPRGGEILLRVETCTIGDYEFDVFRGVRKVAVPAVLGREMAGRIESLGPAAPRTDAAGHPLEIGTRIVPSSVAACGECFCCQRRLGQKCLRAIKYGVHGFAPGYELLGGLSEHCLLMPGTMIVRVPDSLEADVAAAAASHAAMIAAAFRCVENLRAPSILIGGGGLGGITAAVFARSRGAAAVLLCDTDPFRLQQATMAAHTVCVPHEDLASAVSDATDGYGVDIVVAFSETMPSIEVLWPQLRLGGTLAIIGSNAPLDASTMSPEHLVQRNLVIRCIDHYVTEDFVQGIRFLAEHSESFEWRSLIHPTVSLSQVCEAFKAFPHFKNTRVGVRP